MVNAINFNNFFISIRFCQAFKYRRIKSFTNIFVCFDLRFSQKKQWQAVKSKREALQRRSLQCNFDLGVFVFFHCYYWKRE